MILPHTYNAALFLMILSMICWGSWANTYKLAGKWRFELYYFDYAFGLLVAAVILAYTAGNLGFDGFSFVDDLMHAGKRQWFLGFSGGVVFNLANMLLLGAISIAGMSVAFPVGIGLALIIGVALNFLLRPAGNATLLFGGCLLVLIAILADAYAYTLFGRIEHEAMARHGRAKSTRRPTRVKGVVVAVVSGVLMGCFFPLVEMGSQGDLGLGPYAIAVVFAVGVFVSTLVFNLFFMNLPLQGPPVELRDYFMKTSFGQHLLGVAGGAIWCVGAVAAFSAASAPPEVHVGPATSYAMGQGSTLISALWGLLLWREFKGADLKIKSLIAVMLVLYACGLTLVSLAPLYAPQ
ncbi:MAG: GRP family sugar transporter [Bryobacteraceae bacterium]|jgi:glucose uptake protein